MIDAIKKLSALEREKINRTLRNKEGVLMSEQYTPMQDAIQQDRDRARMLAKEAETIRRAKEERAKIDGLIASSKAKFDAKASDLIDAIGNGSLNLRTFRARFLDALRKHLLTATLASLGNISRLGNSDIRRVDNELKTQARYLDNWLAQLERVPRENWSLPQMKIRAKMYGAIGGRISQETIDKRVFKSFPNLPFYPAEKTLCKNNCKCHWQWNVLDAIKGDADVKWVLGQADHCQSCVYRARDFNPLKIRGFNFENMPSDLSIYFAD